LRFQLASHFHLTDALRESGNTVDASPLDIDTDRISNN
jgi:hypothetical protein